MLSDHAEGDTIRYWEMFPVLRALDIPVERVAVVLDEMGVLVDDRCPSFDAWLARKLDVLHGSRRQNTLVGLRSLFAFCKKNGTVFRNPTTRIKVGQQEYGVIQPLSPARSTTRSPPRRPRRPASSWRSPPSTPPDRAPSVPYDSTRWTSATAVS